MLTLALRFSIVVATIVEVVASAHGAEIADEEIQAWVRDLGHAEFVARERAQDRLIDAGERGEMLVLEAIHSADPEIQHRARAIARAIGAGRLVDPTEQECERMANDLASVKSEGDSAFMRIVSMGRRATPALLKLCESGDVKSLMMPLAALVQIADPRSYGPLAELGFRGSRGTSFVLELIYMNDHRAIGQLLRVWHEKGDEASSCMLTHLRQSTGHDPGDSAEAWLKWYRETWAPQGERFNRIKKKLSKTLAATAKMRRFGESRDMIMLQGITANELESIAE
jgi:hypothetical protein